MKIINRLTKSNVTEWKFSITFFCKLLAIMGDVERVEKKDCCAWIKGKIAKCSVEFAFCTDFLL